MLIKKAYLISIVLIFAVITNFAQQNELLNQARDHMQFGRYGEAIDLLNKYIAANPREIVGFNLRGLSFEKRGQYQNAVFDFRNALKIDPDNKDIQTNLNRVTKVWHDQLYRKIEGHKREIAIRPEDPVNYLEIGKAYKNLELWDLAEEWYDKYLEKDNDASADEIIRYTEILAQNNHLQKGEEILKKYVDKLPGDWRLWSRYGYFLLWLGKNRNAAEAFEQALAIKPFFNEAQDGLNLARREGLVVDQPEVYQKEFPIDRYYRILRSNPKNDEIRFKLVDELVANKRLEEAYQQLLELRDRFAGTDRFDRQWDFVTAYREEKINDDIQRNLLVLELNPSETESVMKVASGYEQLGKFEEAFNFLDDYFSKYPNTFEPELRLKYARSASNTNKYDLAIKIVDKLLSDYPENLDYQLFRAQLSAWTSKDLGLAKNFLENIITNDSKNLTALITLSSVMIQLNNFDAALDYARMAKSLDPENKDVAELFSSVELRKVQLEEQRIYGILETGRGLVRSGKCEEALPYYERFLIETTPKYGEIKEYGDVLTCAKKYDQALAVYDQLLDEKYDKNVLAAKGRLYLEMDSTARSLEIFSRLRAREPRDFDIQLSLLDLYTTAGEYDSARTIYYELQESELDSAQTEKLRLRGRWLPPSTFTEVLESVPTSIAFAPSGSFYSDDIGFRLYKYGGRLELGIMPSLSFGVSLFRTSLSSETQTRLFTTFKGHVFVKFLKFMSAGLSSGRINSTGITASHETDLFVRAEPVSNFSIQGSFVSSDAGILLYSPFLVNIRRDASIFKLEGSYLHRTGVKLSSFFQYVKVDEKNLFYGDNEGNSFQLRISRKFLTDLETGYEYFFSNFKFDSDFYYSPQDFVSHSIFGKWEVEKHQDFNLFFLGKLGYVPQNDFTLFEVSGEFMYKMLNNFSISGSLTLGSTSRDDASYNYLAGAISAYWTLL